MRRVELYLVDRARLWIVALLFGAMLVASGCAAPGSQNSEAGQKSGGSKNTLDIGGYDQPIASAAVKEFEKRNPEIKVNVDPSPYDFENGKIQSAIRSGGGPDVYFTFSGPGRIGQLSDAGLIRPLDDIYKENNLEDKYQDQVIEQIRRSGDGQIYEIVEGLDVFQVYYNKKIFNQNGLEAPKTWDQFVDNCQTLDDAGVSPMVTGARDNYAAGWLLGTLVQSASGQKTMSNVIYGDGNFDQQEVVQGARMLKELVDKGCLNGEDANALEGSQANAIFIGGKAATMVMPQGVFSDEAREAGVDSDTFGSFPMPSLNPERPSLVTSNLALSWIVDSKTDNMDAARKWLDWVSSEDYQKLIVKNNAGFFVPARKTSEESEPAVEDATAKYEKGSGYNPSAYLSTAEVEAWYQAVDGILSGKVSPEQAMKEMDQATDDGN